MRVHTFTVGSDVQSCRSRYFQAFGAESAEKWASGKFGCEVVSAEKWAWLIGRRGRVGMLRIESISSATRKFRIKDGP